MALMKPANINLGGNKADPTLVNMAFKMTDAATPADMSNVFARMADSYDRTMRGNAQMWGQVIEAVTPFVEEAVGNFAESQRYKTTSQRYQNEDGTNSFLNGNEYTRVLGPEEEGPSTAPQTEGSPGWSVTSETSDDPSPRTTTERTLGLNDISKELRSTWDPTKGNPFSKENKQKRMQLQMKKQQIFDDIDLLESGFNDIAEKLGSDNYYRDAMYTDSANTRLLNAIGTMHNPTGKTKDGDYVQTGYDSENRMVLRLFDKNNDPVLKNKKNPRSEQISIKANELSTMVTPKLTRKEKDPFNKLWQDFIKQGTKRGTNLVEAGDTFANNARDLIRNEKTLSQVQHEKHFLNFQGSFINDLMATKGKGSKLSATMFTALKDINGVDASGNPNIPTGKDGKPLDINISGGSDKNALDEMDFSGDGVGLQNYAMLASAYTNRSSEHYVGYEKSKELTIHWMQTKGMEKAMVAQGKIPPVDYFGKNGADKMNTDSSVLLNNIIKSAKNGDFSQLTLPKKSTYGESGVIKWNNAKGYFQIEQDGKTTPLTGDKDIRTNFGLRKLMSDYGVSDVHYNQYAGGGIFKAPLFNMVQFKQIQMNKNAGKAPWEINAEKLAAGREETFKSGNFKTNANQSESDSIFNAIMSETNTK